MADSPPARWWSSYGLTVVTCAIFLITLVGNFALLSWKFGATEAKVDAVVTEVKEIKGQMCGMPNNYVLRKEHEDLSKRLDIQREEIGKSLTEIKQAVNGLSGRIDEILIKKGGR